MGNYRERFNWYGPTDAEIAAADRKAFLTSIRRKTTGHRF